MGEHVLKSDGYFTYKELRDWPEEERWELIDGEAFAMSSPTSDHQRVLIKLVARLADWFESKSCEPFVAPLDVLLRIRPEQDEDEVDTVLQPDLMVVCDPGKVHRNGIHGAPDWVLEILSPSTTWRDQTIKRGLYEKHGVKEYWVLNPDTLDLMIYRLVDGKFAAPIGASLKDPVSVGLFPGLILRLT